MRFNVEYSHTDKRNHRVKLPKTFLAVNLSDAFTFQEKERQNSEGDVFDKDHQSDEHDGLEMKQAEPSKSSLRDAHDGPATDSVRDDKSSIRTMEALPPPISTSISKPGQSPKISATGNDAQSQPE